MSSSIFQFLSICFKIFLIFLHSSFYHNSWTFVNFGDSSTVNALSFLTCIYVRKEFEMWSCGIAEIKSTFSDINWRIMWTMQLMSKIKMNEFILRIHVLVCSYLSSLFPNLTFKISHHVSLRLRFRSDHPIHIGWSSVRSEHRILTCVLRICSSCSIARAHVGWWSTRRPIWIMELSFCLLIITDNTSGGIGSSSVEISCGHSSCYFSVFYKHWRRGC